MSASVTVAVVADRVAPGEDLVVTVTASGDDVTGVRAELCYVNEYMHKAPESGGGQGDTGSVVGDLAGIAADLGPEAGEAISATVDVARAAAPGDAPLIGAHELRLPVPADAPPTAGDLVRWKVRAMADVAVGPHAEAEAEVTVVTSPQIGAATLEERAYRDPQLEVRFSHEPAVRPGDTITGTIVLTPEKATKLSGVHLAIRGTRDEQDKIKFWTTTAQADVTGKTKLGAGERLELPFSITVPADAIPTFLSYYNRLDYAIVASGARRMRFDIETTVAIYVSSPSAAPETRDGRDFAR